MTFDELTEFNDQGQTMREVAIPEVMLHGKMWNLGRAGALPERNKNIPDLDEHAARQTAILSHVRDNPGVKSPQIAEATGYTLNELKNHLSGLLVQGRMVRDDNNRYYLAE